MSSETGGTALVGRTAGSAAGSAGSLPGGRRANAIEARVLEGELLAGGAWARGAPRQASSPGPAHDRDFGAFQRGPGSGERPPGGFAARGVAPDRRHAAAFYQANAAPPPARRGIDLFA